MSLQINMACRWMGALAFALVMVACSEPRVDADLARDSGGAPNAANAPRIVFLGDSLTAGYGIDPNDAYPALIQERIDERGWRFEVVNAGVSGDTTAQGLSRIDWLLRKPADVFVLALGGNDGLRGTPLEETQRNLAAIIEKVRDREPGVELVLAGMKAVPNMGLRFTSQFEGLFSDVADEYDTPFIPFLLEGVGGVASLNLVDRIHPNEDGHKVIAEVVWDVLEDVLEDRVDA